MAHQRMSSTVSSTAADAAREAHAVSLKVLRLSKPSLTAHHPLQAGISSPNSFSSIKRTASLAYPPLEAPSDPLASPAQPKSTLGRSAGLTPLLALPPSFGSAYVGETFSCTLCVNNELDGIYGVVGDGQDEGEQKQISAIRIEAEMKTPAGSVALEFGTGNPADEDKENLPEIEGDDKDEASGVLPAGRSVQKIVSYRLLQEGNHVLAVTVRYTENTASKGRVRTFRKLYQFVAKGCMVVRTKTSKLPDAASTSGGLDIVSSGEQIGQLPESAVAKRRRWVLEAQLENCGEETLCLQNVVLQTTNGLLSTALNWHLLPDEGDDTTITTRSGKSEKPILNPKDVQQVCFLVDQLGDELEIVSRPGAAESRLTLGQLSIAWTSALGNEGVLLTGWLGTKFS